LTPKSDGDDEIDRLYQLPIGEFTAARNALAKELGATGAPVRALEKPNLPAWAVNQLFWRKPNVYKKLIAAADARRAAHAKMLAGKGGDIAAAESAHSTALRAAADEIRTLLSGAGETPTSATMNAVTETLQALPGSTRPGRLTKPLKLAGFEALAGLVPTSARTLRGLSPMPRPAPAPAPARVHHDKDKEEKPDRAAAKREADAMKREEAARRKEIAGIDKALRDARAEARKAETELAAARKALAREKAERDHLQDQLQFAMKKIDNAVADVRAREQRVAQAGQELSHLEAKLASLGSRDSR